MGVAPSPRFVSRTFACPDSIIPISPLIGLEILRSVLWVSFQDQLSVGVPMLKDLL